MNQLIEKLKTIDTRTSRSKLELVACERCGAYSFWKRMGGIGNSTLARRIKCCRAPLYWHVNLQYNKKRGTFNITGSRKNFKIGEFFRITDYFPELLIPDLLDNPWIQTYEAVG
jgi:hypothetical protein